MNGSKRNIILISGIAMAVLVVCLAVALVDQRLAASRVEDRIAQQKALLTKYKREAGECTNSQRNYKAFCLTLGGRLPQCSWSEQMPYMLAQIEGLAMPRAVKIETLQPQPMSSCKNILRFPLRIGLQADLATLTGLLEDIEKATPVLEVDHVGIRNSHGQAGKLQVDMTVSSFVALDDKAPLVKRRAIRAAAKPAVDGEKAADLEVAGESKTAADSPGVPAKPVAAAGAAPVVKPAAVGATPRGETKPFVSPPAAVRMNGGRPDAASKPAATTAPAAPAANGGKK